MVGGSTPLGASRPGELVARSAMSSGDENPIPRLDTCCGCIQLKMGVLILCVLQMIAAVFMILLIGSYLLFGSA